MLTEYVRAAALYLLSASILTNNLYAAAFSYNGGHLNLANGTIEQFEVTDLITSDKANIYFDADFSGAEPANDTLAVSGSVQGDFRINGVNILSEGIKNGTLTFMTGASLPALNYFAAYTTGGKYSFAVGSALGQFDFRKEQEAIEGAITSGDAFRQYALQDNIVVSGPLGAIGGVDSELLIVGNGYGIDGAKNNGISIAAGNTLTMGGIGSLNEDGTIKDGYSNFYTEIADGKVKSSTINNSGNLNLEQSVISGNKTVHLATSTVNAQPYVYGGAIYNSGILSINNSYLANNSAEITATSKGQEVSGGAIYNEGALSVNNSVFENNSVYSPYRGTGAHGGSIYNIGTALIKNTVFKNHNLKANNPNSIIGDYHYNILGTLTLINTSFKDNTSRTLADGSGVAGVAVNSSKGDVSVYNSSFKNNIADTTDFTGSFSVNISGVVMNLANATAKIVNSIFEDNTGIAAVTQKPNNSTVAAGAIFSQGSTLYLQADGGNTIFRNNKIGKKDAVQDNVALDIRGSSSSSSHMPFYLDASNGGQVIFDDKIKHSVITLDFNINKNTVDINDASTPRWAPKGGEIVINNLIDNGGNSSYDAFYNLYGGIFRLGQTKKTDTSGNIKVSDENLAPGFINIENGIISLANGAIAKNLKIRGIKGTDNAQMHIDADFANGTNDTLGISTSGTPSSGKLNLTGINIMSDGDISTMTLFKEFSGWTLSNAPALNSLNAYSNDYKYAFTPLGQVDTYDKGYGRYNVKRTAASANGGLYDAVKDAAQFRSYSTGSDVELKADLGNMAGQKDSLLTMLVNKYNIDGKGLNGFNVGKDLALNIFDVGNTESEESAGFTGFGGNVIVNNGTANIYHSVFSNNNDTVLVHNGGMTTVTEGVFKNNTSAGNGGALNSTAAQAYLYNSTFDANKADNGGALYNTGAVTIVNSSFTNNTAANEGGAIYNSGVLTINANAKDIEFTGNTAKGESNAITLDGSGILNLNAFEGNSITFNDAVTAKTGAAIININKDKLAGLDSAGTILVNNTFGGKGASLNVYNGVLKTVEENYLDNNNLSLNGGALDLRNGKIGSLTLASFAAVENSKLYIDIDELASDTINTESASGTVTVGGVNILKDIDSATYTIFTNAAAAIKGSKAFTNSSVYDITAGAQAGSIDVKNLGASAFDGFRGAVEDDGEVRSFSATEDVYVAKDMPVFGGNNAELTLFGNGKAINGNGHKGIELSADHTANIFEAGNINGFKGEDEGSFIKNAGNVNVAGSVFGQNSVEGSNATGGVISNNGAMTVENSVFSANSAVGTDSARGGAIAVNGDLTIKNTSFINNTVTADDDANALGGAIYIADGKTLNVNSDGGNVIFSGNKANGNANAIHLGGSSSVLNLNAYSALGRAAAQNGIVFDDAITSDNISNQININQADGSNTPDGSVFLNNSISNSTINLFGGNLFLASDNLLDGNNMNIDGGAINLQNGTIGRMNFNDLNLNGDINLGIDADLENQTTDFIEASGNVSGSGKLIINSINITKDTDRATSIVPAVSDNLKDSVQLDATTALSPLYKYNVDYDALTGALNFLMANSGTLSDYNPAALASPVAAQVGSYLAQIKAYEQALGNVGMYTDEMPKEKDREFWFKPFSDFGDVPLKDGPKVDNTAYGALIGVDTYSRPMLFGLEGYYSLYAGYTGSVQKYDGVKVEQNGGIGGLGMTMYGEHFFTGITATAGYSDNKADTAYGRDTFRMLSAGAALKAGYNIELPFYALVLQPSVIGSYTFVNPEDYTNAAGLDVKADSLNVFQAAPAVKLAANMSNGWSPALEAQMVWSFFNDSKFIANGATLPNISVDPYFEYGLSLQKVWTKDFSSYIKGMLRTGGLEGGTVQLGLKLAM